MCVCVYRGVCVCVCARAQVLRTLGGGGRWVKKQKLLWALQGDVDQPTVSRGVHVNTMINAVPNTNTMTMTISVIPGGISPTTHGLQQNQQCHPCHKKETRTHIYPHRLLEHTSTTPIELIRRGKERVLNIQGRRESIRQFIGGQSH